MRALVLALLLGACASTARAPTAVEIAADNSRARGGAGAIEAIRAVDVRLTINEGDMTLSGHYRANRDGCMRIDVSVEGTRVFTEALNGEGGWSMSQGAAAPQPNSTQGNAALRHGVESPLRLFGLHEFPRRGHQLTAAGAETVEGRNYVRLDAVYRDGYRAELYLDPATHLLVRMREHKPMHVDVDPTPRRVETRFSDYRPVSGVLYPFRSEEVDLDTGAALSVAQIERIEANSVEALAICSSAPPPA